MDPLAPEPEYLNDDFLLRTISDGTASETGTQFFRALVKNLSQALGTHGAWVTEFFPDENRLRALAFWLGDDFVEHYEYSVPGTPCEPAITEKTYQHIPENVVALFPGDPDLPKLGAVSYMGFPLLGPEDDVLGNIAVLDTKPMPASYRNLALFRIFAARATAELLRQRAEAELRDREEKLRSVFDGAMDAIVQLDRDFRIVMMNPSAHRMFDGSAQSVGRTFEHFLEKKDFHRLTGMARGLENRPGGRSSTWISNGLPVVNSHGEKIRTDATLSRLQVNGAAYYVLILRDVNERYAAEKTIASLKVETHYLRDEIRALYNHGNIIGKSGPFRRILELVAEVAPTDSTVLLHGETGTGKELLARAIHTASRRKDRPMVTVNCAAIPQSLMESEFFGHEKGAFTGATQSRRGRFSLADRGTIFLDEVGELNLEMQSKLLRVLQEREFTPVGSSRNQQVDVRVIAATNRDLSKAVQHGTFRTDLYYRLSVFPISIPPLRERGNDIGLLAGHFIEKYALQMGRPIAPIDPDLLDRLKKYSWPGNVRELQNVIERGVITARHGYLNLGYALPQAMPEGEKPAEPVDSVRTGTVLTTTQMQQLERDNIHLALRQCKWRVAGKDGAARLLGMPPSTLQSRMKALGIERPG
jgi:PAS domain S-box-containing protein